jgi:hypothetical protein
MASPVLVIVSGNAVTTWECLKEKKPFTFYPHDDLPISDATWNHNGQGTSKERVLSLQVQMLFFLCSYIGYTF